MRNITIKEMQKVIANINIYAESEICPDFARALVKAIADILEQILCNQSVA